MTAPRFARFCAAIVVATALAPIATASDPKVESGDDAPKHELRIRPKQDAPWGGDIDNVQAVLESAAKPLWVRFPDRKLPVIAVEPKGGPIALFERRSDGAIQVRLDTGDRLWAQHAYQFAHEFCHILCNYQEDPHRNLWFEESLCEMASLYSLRQMAIAWKSAPPYPNWKDYGPKLQSYAAERIAKAQLPPRKTLGDWYADHSFELSQNAVVREKNTLVAVALLPLFEKSPEHWEAVAWLNTGKPLGSQTLAQFLQEWRDNAPIAHREFIADVARQFKIALTANR